MAATVGCPASFPREADTTDAPLGVDADFGLLSPINARKAVKFVSKVRILPTLQAVFGAFSLRVGTSDLVQSIGF